MSISVIIPVYKNKELFLRIFAHNYPLFKKHQIIVIDDASNEDIKQELEKYAGVSVLENRINQGFGRSVNRGVESANGELIMLLNSDVKLQDASYEKVIYQFNKDKKLFAISFAQKEKHGEIVGKNKVYFKNGFFHHEKAHDLKPGLNGWAEGGSCIIRRDYFTRLSGLDPLYFPFYWEDIDLSYRAYKRGWKVLFDQSILVEHHHESTIGKYFDKNDIRSIAYRNQFIFIWKNISDKNLLIDHILNVPIYIIKAIVNGDTALIKGHLMAMGMIVRILNSRKLAHVNEIMDDKAILQLFK